MIAASSTLRSIISFARARARNLSLFLPTLIAISIAIPVLAQVDTEIAPEGDILVDVLPRFVTSFRERSWVPVDIMVSNNMRDISGVVEVTLIEFDEPRGPNYRLPVESPKGSRKRFRVYCNFGKASSLEVMLYSGRRRALPDPVKLNLLPIDKNDVLALVLDDEPTEYGFLYSAVQRVSPGIGFHREGMGTSELSQLPEYPQCYDPFTMIVLGRIDPGEVPPRQRELLRRYVEHGGIVVLCVGENATRLRGTWVEQLAGVSIGEILPSDELALARGVFDEARVKGAREGKSVVYARIAPSNECYVQNLGGQNGGLVLATVRSIGSGHVAAIAVDASGKALQGTEGFGELWSSLVALREEAAEPHYDVAAWQAANTLPAATGIHVYPRSSVLIYLGLYFAIGIVGNWVFWSLLKRREMAWVCLVFISFGFTAYALVYGTAGRAKETEIAQMEVLRLPLESPSAKLRSTVGVVAARSSRYTLSFPNAFPLISDIEARSLTGMPNRSPLMGRIGAFQFVQGPTATVNNFTVGASEMRIIQVESEIASPGKIEGKLTWDGDGIHGELVNDTGLNVRNPFLLVNGARAPLRVDGNRWTATIANSAVNSREARLDSATQNNLISMGYYGGYYGNQLVETTQVREQYAKDLFASERNQSFADERVGPYVCGWIDQKPFRSVDLGEPANERIYATLLIADVEFDVLDGAAPRRIELDTAAAPLGAQNNQFRSGYYSGGSLRYSISSGQPSTVQLAIPRSCLAHEDATLEIDVYVGPRANADTKVNFYPKGLSASWSEEHQGETVKAGGDNQNRRGQNDGDAEITTYTIDDWKSLVDPQTLNIDGEIAVVASGPTPDFANVDIRARLYVPQTQSYSGVWKKWQL